MDKMGDESHYPWIRNMKQIKNKVTLYISQSVTK